MAFLPAPSVAELRVGRVDPRASERWSRVVDEAGDAALAHAPEWYTAIRQAYGHEPLYLEAEDGDGRAAMLPAFVVRRPFLGTVVASMPFLDAGGPCGASPDLARILVERLLAEAHQRGAAAAELRCAVPLSLGLLPMEDKVNLTLSLPSDAASLWRRLDSSVRSQVRKAERAGLTVETAGPDRLGEFYGVFAARMRDLGSPVHGRRFFAAVLEAFGPRARLVLVRRGTATIGGLVALVFKDRLAVPWAACLREYFPLCPNMLLYWETIRAACQDGLSAFEFGRSSRDSGTYRFKRQWGAVEAPLFWYTLPVRRRTAGRLSPASGAGRVAARLWRALPLSLTRRLGPDLRRYLTQ